MAATAFLAEAALARVGCVGTTSAAPGRRGMAAVGTSVRFYGIPQNTPERYQN